MTAQAALGVVLEDWMQMWVKEERAAEQRPFLWEAPWTLPDSSVADLREVAKHFKRSSWLGWDQLTRGSSST